MKADAEYQHAITGILNRIKAKSGTGRDFDPKAAKNVWVGRNYSKAELVTDLEALVDA